LSIEKKIRRWNVAHQVNNLDNLLSKRIRSIREQLGYSQERLAELLGISRVTVSQMEAGRRKLSASDLKKLSDILEMPADYLLNPEKEPEVVIQEVRENEEPVQSMRVSVPQEKVDKFKEVLLYILNRVGAMPNVGRTVVYKLLYFIDFDYYEQYEEQLIGARYQKKQYGPIPMEFAKIVQKMEQDGDLTEVKNEYFERLQTKYLARRTPDLSVLSGQELKVIEDVLCRLSDKNGTEISAYSHGDVPWLATEDGQVIDYELAFYRTPPYSRRQYTEDV
jgi:transcriptional regulator with XRE-family HTH domain